MYKTATLFISKNAINLAFCLVSVPTYETLLNYGNDGCDGFAPNFPLIRSKRNQAAKYIQLQHELSCEDIIPPIHLFVNGYEQILHEYTKGDDENSPPLTTITLSIRPEYRNGIPAVSECQ